VKNPPEVFDTEVSLVQKQRGATIRPFAQPFSGLENPACGIAKGAYVFFAPPLLNPYRIPAKGAYVFFPPPSRFPAMREMGPKRVPNTCQILWQNLTTSLSNPCQILNGLGGIFAFLSFS